MEPWNRLGFFVNYIARILEGIRIGLTLKVANPKEIIIYSASEFWMDSLPAFILKMRYPKITWAAAWYQTAPKPWTGYWAFPYWFVQLPIKPLISKYADFVLVNNEEEKKQFPKHDKNGKAIVVLGAVDLKKIKNEKLKMKSYKKIYDGVFQGRFHPQKGVLELVDIWRRVVEQKPDARLVMIGGGPLMETVKRKVKSEKLENNIRLTGYLFDGEEKYKIFAQSKLVVHPAFYDSGGMASAEAMAFGLPAIGFNLRSFKSYYPFGMVKVKVSDLASFAEAIVNLLDDSAERTRVGKEALKMIEKNWSWDKRAQQVLSQII